MVQTNVITVDFKTIGAKKRLDRLFRRVALLEHYGYSVENQQELTEIHDKIINEINIVWQSKVDNDV
jgi:hypothetical protein